jgi:hypothetical protein
MTAADYAAYLDAYTRQTQGDALPPLTPAASDAPTLAARAMGVYHASNRQGPAPRFAVARVIDSLLQEAAPTAPTPPAPR